jgi:hypothetical protein
MSKTHYMQPGASWSPCHMPVHRCVYTAAWSDVTCGNCLRSVAHREALAIVPEPAQIQRYVAEVQRMITEDMAAGVIPDTARSFAELHDHVDANMYVIDALDGYQPRGDELSEVVTSDAESAMANAVMDAVDAWLRSRGAPDWCHTCGNPVYRDDTERAGTCACWCQIAQALEQYAGIDFDSAALMASELWAREADRERVWSAEYAGDHFQTVNGWEEPIPTYPRPAGLLTSAERAMALDATENSLNRLEDAGVTEDNSARLRSLHDKLSDSQPWVLSLAELWMVWGALTGSIVTADPRCTGDLDGMRAMTSRLGYQLGALS